MGTPNNVNVMPFLLFAIEIISIFNVILADIIVYDFVGGEHAVWRALYDTKCGTVHIIHSALQPLSRE